MLLFGAPGFDEDLNAAKKKAQEQQEAEEHPKEPEYMEVDVENGIEEEDDVTKFEHQAVDPVLREQVDFRINISVPIVGALSHNTFS